MNNESDSDSDSDNEEERKEDDVDQTPTESMNLTRGFSFGQNGIFINSNEKDDYADDENNSNPTNFNISPTSRQTKLNKHQQHNRKKANVYIPPTQLLNIK